MGAGVEGFGVTKTACQGGEYSRAMMAAYVAEPAWGWVCRTCRAEPFQRQQGRKGGGGEPAVLQHVAT
jgi:hypothetical protein